MKKEYSWTIHLVTEEPDKPIFHPGMCDAHTHGLDKYGSKEIQFVLGFSPQNIGYILNTVGEMVRDGLKLHDGMYIENICADEAKIKVFETKDVFGDPVFRLIMPDGEFKYPEDSEEYPYNLQYISPYIGE